MRTKTMAEINHVNFVSEAYMPKTYFQMVRTKNEGEIEVRLSDRMDSGLFNLREGDRLILQMDTGNVPTDKEIGIP